MASKRSSIEKHGAAEVLSEKQGFHSPTTTAAEDVFRTPDGLHDNEYDVGDMKRLGKAQEFKRNFSYISTLGFISVYMATWEIAIIVLSAGLYSGGFAGLLWAFFITCIAYAPVVASLAEMESMAPTSGGQYHWVSEFAPPSCQKALSYASGESISFVRSYMSANVIQDGCQHLRGSPVRLLDPSSP